MVVEGGGEGRKWKKDTKKHLLLLLPLTSARVRAPKPLCCLLAGGDGVGGAGGGLLSLLSLRACASLPRSLNLFLEGRK